MIAVDGVSEIQRDLEGFVDPPPELLKSEEINVKAFLMLRTADSLKESNIRYVPGERKFRSLELDQDREYEKASVWVC